jgi:hypothetical protein
MNKRSLLIFGLFWALLVPIVSAGTVACDGLYWGDSVDGPTADAPNGYVNFLDTPGAQHALQHRGENAPQFQGQDDLITITSGLYWGD